MGMTPADSEWGKNIPQSTIPDYGINSSPMMNLHPTLGDFSYRAESAFRPYIRQQQPQLATMTSNPTLPQRQEVL